ncbi:hypothetical protein [Rhodococcus koreensis]
MLEATLGLARVRAPNPIRLVPGPTTAEGGTPTDRDWQNAVADRENTRAQQRHRGRNQHTQEHADPPDLDMIVIADAISEPPFP